jgi:hypothetical protein
VEYIRQLLREKDEAQENYSQETIRSQRLASELEAAQADRAIVRAQLTATDSRVACKSFLPKHRPFFSQIFISDLFASVLESQVQAIHAAAATATGSVNARGDTVAAYLEDIPNRVRDVAGHGVHCGAAVALATAQFQTGHDLLQVEPVRLPLGSEDWWIFEELTDDMEMAAAAISEDVSIEAVIGNVFADD